MRQLLIVLCIGTAVCMHGCLVWDVRGYLIDGIVVDASTGLPLENAIVRLHAGYDVYNRVTVTDTEGYFWYVVRMSGGWVVDIGKHGFASQTLEVLAEDPDLIMVELTPDDGLPPQSKKPGEM